MYIHRLGLTNNPQGEGYSLYLRPTVISTHRFLGVAPPENLLLYVITSPVGPYYKTGFQPIRLTCDTPYVRAWPGGTGMTPEDRSFIVDRLNW
jgi:branched-chain amino acid aminotransferase